MKRCSVGGQAVLEGVVMKNPAGGMAMAVRKSDGTIVTEYNVTNTLARKGTFFGLPIVRGVVNFVEALASGMRATTRSAELYGEEERTEQPTRLEKWLADRWNKSAMDVAILFAVILAVVLAVGLFVFLPSFVCQLIPWREGAPRIWKSLTEGGVRLLIFLAYISSISAMKDIRRVYMYHGAEHKTIACYEHDAELTPENAIRFSRLHARCGTNYLFLVMAVSILFFAIIPYQENLLLRFLTRVLCIPMVAGISYEVLKAAAASESLLARIVRAPGMALQYLTTREPTLDMIEVAIASFHLAMEPEKYRDGSAKTDPSERGNEDGNGTCTDQAKCS